MKVSKFPAWIGSVLVVVACSSEGASSETGPKGQGWNATIEAERIKKGSRDSVGAVSEAKTDEDQGPFDLDTDGDGDWDAYLVDYETRVEELSEPDRSQATKDYNPPPGENEFVQVDTDAQPLNLDVVHAAIRYPEAAQKEGIEGPVRLKVLIDMDGWYSAHVLRGSPDRRLTAAVLEQVKKMQYRPALRDGKPVKVWVNFEHIFKLPKE